MARINVEDTIWKKAGFQTLMIKVGDRHKAMGMIIDLWALAQEYWFPDRQCIPHSEFEEHGLSVLTECAGLVEVRIDGVYACGAEVSFDWLFQKQVAGKRSAESKAKKSRKGQRKSTHVEHPLTDVERASTSISTSFSDSFSSSSSISISDSERTMYSVPGEPSAQPPSVPQEIRSPIGFFIANYVNAFQMRYGAAARPALSGKHQGQIKRFLQETPLERACQLIQVYVAMNDSWFITKTHDFGTFIENLSKVGVALDTGFKPTQTEIRQADQAQAISNNFAAARAARAAKAGDRG